MTGDRESGGLGGIGKRVLVTEAFNSEFCITFGTGWSSRGPVIEETTTAVLSVETEVSEYYCLQVTKDY